MSANHTPRAKPTDHASLQDAPWLAAIESSDWVFKVQSSSGPRASQQAISSEMPIGKAITEVARMHKQGLRARVLRERVQREIVDTTGAHVA